jgi:solute:Na+ symporter, SSS family
MNLHVIDAAIVVIYLVMMLAVGIYLERRAGKNMETYFLGGRSIPWWLLGMSGSGSYFDITGTMWMVSVFYLLGMRGMWEHWFWGFPVAGIMLAYRAKWAYRSGVLTGLEWLIFRYGSGKAGQAARLMALVVAILSMVFMIGYAGVGVAKFVEEFVSIKKSISIPILFGITGIYTALGGFYSVVISDLYQTTLLTFAAIYISVVAFLQIDPAGFHQAVGNDWFSLAPVMNLANPPKEYPDPFGLLVLMWVSKGVLGLVAAGGGGADFQRFRAARNEGEASKIGMAWGVFLSVRWSLVMAFTVFGLSILPKEFGAVDSEMVLPIVLNRVIPVGIKGVILAGLLSAFMNSVDSMLNVAASFLVNDFVKPVWKKATPKGLVWASYISTLGVMTVGIFISFQTEHIAAIWNPINFALGAALLAPGLLAPYWWRIGGWAVCASAACTLPAAFYVKVFTDWRELQYFPLLAGISLISCVVASYVFPPAPKESLMDFYRKVRPFGFWTPVKRMLEEKGENVDRFERDRWDIPVALIGTLTFVLLYLLMMDLVLHNWSRAIWLGGGTLAGGALLYFLWWRHLLLEDDQESE